MGSSLILGKAEGRRRRGRQNEMVVQHHPDSMVLNLRKLQEIVKNREPGMLQSMGVTKSQTQLSD